MYSKDNSAFRYKAFITYDSGEITHGSYSDKREAIEDINSFMYEIPFFIGRIRLYDSKTGENIAL